MGNSNYNSLTEILNGLMPNEQENFFEKKQEAAADSPFEEENITLPKKRLNNDDLELINKSSEEAIKKNNGLKKIIYKLFPRLYKAHLIKEAMAKFLELNIDPKTLLDKRIPYGEAELRYKDLVKYLKYASEIQAQINSKNP